MLAKVSHELRTPLSAILGLAEMLEVGEHDSLTPSQSEMIGQIIKSTNYLTDMVNQLLDQAKTDTARLHPGSATI